MHVPGWSLLVGLRLTRLCNAVSLCTTHSDHTTLYSAAQYLILAQPINLQMIKTISVQINAFFISNLEEFFFQNHGKITGIFPWLIGAQTLTLGGKESKDRP